jgi:hypothetical protein
MKGAAFEREESLPPLLLGPPAPCPCPLKQPPPIKGIINNPSKKAITNYYDTQSIFLGWNIRKSKNISYKKIAPHTAKASTSRVLQWTK